MKFFISAFLLLAASSSSLTLVSSYNIILCDDCPCCQPPIAHDNTTSGLTTFKEPTATTDPRNCFNDYRSCLLNASTVEGRYDCRSRFKSCLGPPGAEVELNDEIHSSNEAQIDTTNSDLNNEGYGLRGNIIKND